jgi:hypothetical protein
MSMFTTRELKLIEHFRNVRLIYEITLRSAKTRIMKLANYILEEIINGRKVELNLMDRLM